LCRGCGIDEDEGRVGRRFAERKRIALALGVDDDERLA
jgi:hypothetical protein